MYCTCHVPVDKWNLDVGKILVMLHSNPISINFLYHLTQPIKSYLQNRPWKINFNDRALDGTDINDINKYKAATPNLLVFKTKS